MKKIFLFVGTIFAIFSLSSCKKEISCDCSYYDLRWNREYVDHHTVTIYKTCKELQDGLNKNYDYNSSRSMYNCMDATK